MYFNLHSSILVDVDTLRYLLPDISRCPTALKNQYHWD